MDYLTNYYKNLSEQLQHRVNNLKQLLEYRKKSTVHLDVVDVDPYTGEDVPRIMGTEVTKKGNPLGKGARKEKIFSVYPGMGAIRNVGDQEYLTRDIVSNSGRPTVQDNPIYASMLGKGPALEVGSGEVFHNRSDMRRKGGSEPGMGKKFKKKNLAIALAKTEAQQAQRAARDLHPNVHDGPDPDTTASSMEVAASQQRRQLGQQPDYWFGTTMNRL